MYSGNTGHSSYNWGGKAVSTSYSDQPTDFGGNASFSRPSTDYGHGIGSSTSSYSRLASDYGSSSAYNRPPQTDLGSSTSYSRQPTNFSGNTSLSRSSDSYADVSYPSNTASSQYNNYSPLQSSSGYRSGYSDEKLSEVQRSDSLTGRQLPPARSENIGYSDLSRSRDISLGSRDISLGSRNISLASRDISLGPSSQSRQFSDSYEESFSRPSNSSFGGFSNKPPNKKKNKNKNKANKMHLQAGIYGANDVSGAFQSSFKQHTNFPPSSGGLTSPTASRYAQEKKKDFENSSMKHEIEVREQQLKVASDLLTKQTAMLQKLESSFNNKLHQATIAANPMPMQQFAAKPNWRPQGPLLTTMRPAPPRANVNFYQQKLPEGPPAKKGRFTTFVTKPWTKGATPNNPIFVGKKKNPFGKPVNASNSNQNNQLKGGQLQIQNLNNLATGNKRKKTTFIARLGIPGVKPGLLPINKGPLLNPMPTMQAKMPFIQNRQLPIGSYCSECNTKVLDAAHYFTNPHKARANKKRNGCSVCKIKSFDNYEQYKDHEKSLLHTKMHKVRCMYGKTDFNLENTKQPAYDKNKPVGEDLVSVRTGIYCEACMKFFPDKTEKMGRFENHLKSKHHYDNWLDHVKVSKLIARIEEKKAAEAKARKESKTNDTDGDGKNKKDSKTTDTSIKNKDRDDVEGATGTQEASAIEEDELIQGDDNTFTNPDEVEYGDEPLEPENNVESAIMDTSENVEPESNADSAIMEASEIGDEPESNIDSANMDASEIGDEEEPKVSENVEQESNVDSENIDTKTDQTDATTDAKVSPKKNTRRSTRQR